jgi:mandelate racemase
VTISALRARPVDLDLAEPMETAAGVMRTAPVVLVDLETDEGVTGHGYVRTFTPVALGALARLLSDLDEVIAGLPLDPDAIAGKLARLFRFTGTQGLTGAAMAAIDMAAWDARAKRAELPLVRLLGGEPRPIPAYASLRRMEPAAAAAEAERAVERGFRGVKLKVGRADPGADLRAIRAVRGAVGDDVELMVDFNQSLSVEEALERLPGLDAEGLAWIEEPTRADDYAGHARIAAAAATPIQLGENLWGPEDLEKSIAGHASDHAMLSAMKIGGVSGWLRAAALAEQAGLPVSSHAFPELSVQLLCVTPTSHRLEYLDHFAPLLAEPVRVEDGHAYVPDVPGSGLSWRARAGP